MFGAGWSDAMPDAGSYPREAGCDFVVELVDKLNGRDGEFEGPLPHAIRRYGRHVLETVPPGELLAEGHSFAPGLATEYAAMDPATRPPCVYHRGTGELLDGNHRCRAALLNGEDGVACYVGVEGSEDPFWSPWEDDDG